MLPPEAQRALLGIARDSLVAGVGAEGGPPGDIASASPELAAQGASFVTLHLADLLRGCVGTLEPYRPLALDVADNAHAAAFRDPRFPAVIAGELEGIQISVTVVGPAQPIQTATEAELIESLRPGVDGLTVEAGAARATFLPAVWAQLPEPEAFLRELRRKAGLAPDYWSPSLRFSRYQSHTFAEPLFPEGDHERDTDERGGAA